jgi:uncharacterized protein (DUF488 family)
MNIWTIGHSTLKIEDFLALLSANGIRTLADVRRFPASRRHPQFNQAELRESLVAEGIEYLYLPELGGRRLARPAQPPQVACEGRDQVFGGR